MSQNWLPLLLGASTALLVLTGDAHSALVFSGAQGAFVVGGASGCGNDTETINNQGKITDNANGFSVAGFSVTYTAKAAGAAGCQFRFSDGFTDNVAEKLKLTVSGNTDVTESAGATGAKLATPGSIVNSLLANVILAKSMTNIDNGANNKNYTWNNSNSGNVAANTDYILNLFTGVSFNAAAAGDSVTLASNYEVSLSPVPPVPLPGSLVLLASGLVLIASRLIRRPPH